MFWSIAMLLTAEACAGVDDIVNALRHRHKQLAKYEVDFSTRAYRSHLANSPLDEAQWQRFTTHDSCWAFLGRLTYLPPESFLVELRPDCEGEKQRDATAAFSWHDGELRFLQENLESNTRRGHRTALPAHGFLQIDPFLTPLGLRTYTFPMSLADVIAALEGPSISTEQAGNVEIAGTVAIGGLVYDITAVIDSERDWVLQYLSMSRDDSGEASTWTFETVDVGQLNGLYFPKRVIYFLTRPRIVSSYIITDWRVLDARPRPTPTNQEVVLSFPEGTVVNDQIDNVRYTVDASGARQNIEDLTKKTEAVRANLEAVEQAEQLRADRRSAAPYILGGAVSLAILVLFVRWRYLKQVA